MVPESLVIVININININIKIIGFLCPIVVHTLMLMKMVIGNIKMLKNAEIITRIHPQQPKPPLFSPATTENCHSHKQHMTNMKVNTKPNYIKKGSQSVTVDC